MGADQTVSTDLKQAMIKARNAKGLTQKQLAQVTFVWPTLDVCPSNAPAIASCAAPLHSPPIAAGGITPPQQLNMQPQVINEYESGKAIPNNAVIAKIERALGAKLPRAAKK